MLLVALCLTVFWTMGAFVAVAMCASAAAGDRMEVIPALDETVAILPDRLV